MQEFNLKFVTCSGVKPDTSKDGRHDCICLGAVKRKSAYGHAKLRSVLDAF